MRHDAICQMIGNRKRREIVRPLRCLNQDQISLTAGLMGHGAIGRLDERDIPDAPENVDLRDCNRIARADDKNTLAGWNGHRLRRTFSHHRLRQRFGEPARTHQKVNPVCLRCDKRSPYIGL